MSLLGIKRNSQYLYKITAIAVCLLGVFLIMLNTQASTLLSDDFTGTTINTLKWNEVVARTPKVAR